MMKAGERDAAGEGIEEDRIREEIKEAFRRLMTADMEKTAEEVAKVCAEYGMTAAEFMGLVKGCGYSLEGTMHELMEKAGVFAKNRRGPTGFEGKHPPMDTRPKYTPPDRTGGRKKKHGREKGRKL